jgi:hypothetical protein
MQSLDKAEQIWNTGKDREVALRLYQEAHDFAKLVQHNAMQATICMGFGYALLEAQRARDAFNMFVFARDVAIKCGNEKQASIAQLFAHTALVEIQDVAAQHKPVNSQRSSIGTLPVLTPLSSPKMATSAKPNNSTQCSEAELGLASLAEVLPEVKQSLEEQRRFCEETEVADCHMQELLTLVQNEEETGEARAQRRKRLSGRKLKKQKRKLAEAAEASLGKSQGDPSQPKEQDVHSETVQFSELKCWPDLAQFSQTAASTQGSTCMETSSSNDGSDLTYRTRSDTIEYAGLAESDSSESEPFPEPPLEALPHAFLEAVVAPPGLKQPPGLKPPPGLLPPPGLGTWDTPEGIYLGLEHGAVDGGRSKDLTPHLLTTSEYASMNPPLTWPDCKSSYESVVIGEVCYVLPIC